MVGTRAYNHHIYKVEPGGSGIRGWPQSQREFTPGHPGRHETKSRSILQWLRTELRTQDFTWNTDTRRSKEEGKMPMGGLYAFQRRHISQPWAAESLVG